MKKRKLLAVVLMAVVAFTGCANSDLNSEESGSLMKNSIQ